MHQYFHIKGITDLAVIRDQANVRTKSGNKYGEPTESVVHLHKADTSCRGMTHEFYALGEVQELVKRFWEAVDEAEEMETVR